MLGPRKRVARALAAAISEGQLAKTDLIERCSTVIGRRPAWLIGLIARVIEKFGKGRRPEQARVERFISDDRGFCKAWERGSIAIIGSGRLPGRMCPAAGPPQTWKVPPLCTVGELAGWLNLTPNELEWFADCRMLEAKLPEGPLRHYRYRWQSKRDGSARLIESPKQRLKAIQRYLLRQILEHIPPHQVVHGFRRQRSVETFVAPHVRQRIVLRLDLKAFFPSVRRARVVAIFLT